MKFPAQTFILVAVAVAGVVFPVVPERSVEAELVEAGPEQMAPQTQAVAVAEPLLQAVQYMAALAGPA